jgi:release factor glutamine methyltransferase
VSGAGAGAQPAAASGTPAREALEGAITAIAAAGCESPRLDGELILAHVLGVSRERLLSDRGLRVSGPAVRAVQEAVRRRSAGREPLAYIIGRRHFRHIELAVDARVLVPRPETELLVEAALSLPFGARVLDVGTGSGAVALALAHERPDLEVAGSDVSADALEVARLNATRLGLELSWLHADLLGGVPDSFDAIVSNPPYVASEQLDVLAPEIVRHEPRRALDGGADGLEPIRELAAQLRGRERVRSCAIEVGEGQATPAAGLLREAGFGRVSTARDLAGIERIVCAQRERGR